MNRPPSFHWLQAVLLAVMTSSLSSFGTALLLQRDPTPPTPAPQDQDKMVRMLEQWRRELGERLQREPVAVPVRSEVAPASKAEPTADVARLAALVDHVAALVAQSRSTGANASIPREAAANARELEALRALQRADAQAARRSTMLLTPQEVASRFGFPDDVGSSGQQGLFWTYYHVAPDGKRDGRTTFVFVDGYVTFHEVAGP